MVIFHGYFKIPRGIIGGVSQYACRIIECFDRCEPHRSLVKVKQENSEPSTWRYGWFWWNNSDINHEKMEY